MPTKELQLSFSLSTVTFDENYLPDATTRTTTNFANLARGEKRRENLRNTLTMIDNRFNALAPWDNPEGDRWSVGLDIISACANLDGDPDGPTFPLIEVLEPTITDRRTGRTTTGIVGNNFSSYVRDYDFSVVLPEHNKDRDGFGTPDGFGVLHGNLFTAFLESAAYTDRFAKSPVICLSVSSSRVYERTGNQHPVLGVEYRQDAFSLTDEYFAKMGMTARFFMPPGSVAPFAFYFLGDLLGDYTDLELMATIATMETFQRIYRPEIYNANSAAPRRFRPSLTHGDHSTTQVVYDRDERSRLAVEQGRFAAEQFVEPHRELLERWSADFTAAHRGLRVAS